MKSAEECMADVRRAAYEEGWPYRPHFYVAVETERTTFTATARDLDTVCEWINTILRFEDETAVRVVIEPREPEQRPGDCKRGRGAET